MRWVETTGGRLGEGLPARVAGGGEWWYTRSATPRTTGRIQYAAGTILRTISFDDPADVARHQRMVALVERMLELHKKLATATIAADKALYERQIEATDREIDALVYELYGLTEDEIATVAGAATWRRSGETSPKALLVKTNMHGDQHD